MRRNSGFTLIELLISVVIFMMITSLIFFSFSQSLSLWERADREIEKLDQMVFFDTWMKGLIHSADNVSLSLRSGTAPFFYGKNDSVLFLTDDPILNRNKVASFVRIEFKQGALVYAEENLFKSDLTVLSPSDIPFGTEYPLLTEVEDGRLSYLAREGAAWDWRDHADSQKTFDIPKAVKIDFLHKGKRIEILAYIQGIAVKRNPALGLISP
jgi:prepilin-type N-terminal cleavage/methylation domain-containing protein